MKRFRVYGGVARIGAGAVLSLKTEQVQARRHALDVLTPAAEGNPQAVVRSTAPLQFKVGEVFGLEGEVPSNLTGIVEPVDKAETEVEKTMAGKAAADRTAARKRAASKRK
jgi:hypothetical protein